MKKLAIAAFLASAVLVHAVQNPRNDNHVTFPASSLTAPTELEVAKQHAEAGSKEAQAWLGKYYERQTPPDWAEAVHWYAAAAEQGDDKAAMWLGRHYELATPANLEQAFIWYRKAADAGNTAAQFKVARMLELGRGTQVQFPLALEAYQQLERKGNVAALFRLGMFYEHGVGVPQDREVAACYYERAKLGGSVAAEARIALAPLVPASALKQCDLGQGGKSKPALSPAKPLAMQPPPPPMLPSPPPPLPGGAPRLCDNLIEVGGWMTDRFVRVAAREEMSSAKMEARVTIGGSGMIEDVEVIKTTVNSPALARLVTETLYGLHCRATGARVITQYPLIFTLTDDEPQPQVKKPTKPGKKSVRPKAR